MVFFALAVLAIPFLLSLALTRMLIAAAPRMGLVDRPAGRKVHRAPTPLGGGIAVFVAIAACLSLAAAAARLAQVSPAILSWVPPELRIHVDGVVSKTPLLMLVLGAGAVQMLLGLIDDWRPGGLGYQLRLFVEVVLVAALVTQGVRLSLFLTDPWVSGGLTVLWVVGLTNAINFLDNMDGLAGGVVFWTSAFFAAIAVLVGSLFVAGCFAVILGAVLGFLVFNWSPARIFLGDAGSNFLGFWLGILTIIGTYTGEGFSHVTVLAPLCVLAVPLYDMTSVIAIRLSQGRSPFQPDRQHFSHRLVELGLPPKYAVLLIHLVTITTGLGGLCLYFLPPLATPIVLAQIACTLLVIAILEFAARRSRSSEASQRAEQVGAPSRARDALLAVGEERSEGSPRPSSP